MGRLLVSVRGPNEALAAAEGGAHVADVEYPASALGTPYPLNIKAVRRHLDEHGFRELPISTNIGEDQPVRRTACQAALGVALAGADYIKCGFAGLNLKSAVYLGRDLVRTIREWFPDKKVYPAVFPEEDFAACLDPLEEGPKLVQETDCDGLLIDTFRKDMGKGLVDYYDVAQLEEFVDSLHQLGKEAWLAGSITAEEIAGLWATQADVLCIRGAACFSVTDRSRFGTVTSEIVAQLVGGNT